MILNFSVQSPVYLCDFSHRFRAMKKLVPGVVVRSCAKQISTRSHVNLLVGLDRTWTEEFSKFKACEPKKVANEVFKGSYSLI